jgi:bacteriocin biosynthesis cyclodehydratase domain-containing protein
MAEPTPADRRRYRLRPSLEPFVGRGGELYVVRPGGDDLVVRDPEALDVALVRRLERAAGTAAELAGALGAGIDAVQRKLDSLAAAGLVLVREPAPSLLGPEDAERFARQLPYLAELGDEQALQRRIRDARVAVLGCGGIGTWVIAALVGAGVGRLTLVDDDRVALSNLNRQMLYARRDVGAAKVSAAAAWVRAFDPAVEVCERDLRLRGPADVAAAIAGADAVVLAADQPPYAIARWVNAACVRAVTPFCVAGQLPPLVKVGPTYVPGEGPCFACHERALRGASAAYDDYVASRATAPATGSTVGAASCVAGGLLGLELMHLLAGLRPATVDCALIVHMQTLEVRREPIRRHPDCELCGGVERDPTGASACA